MPGDIHHVWHDEFKALITNGVKSAMECHVKIRFVLGEGKCLLLEDELKRTKTLAAWLVW